ncbi:phosphatidylserine decarboxylase [Sulfuriferula multivorans]|uniref:Phosphatidylserine decarboxylase proenzyme n=1 Tax=Sulfuriferula multivorans TaxID=1559896 RepID=A0A401JEI9_9PROT|nr:phosphatidylserine decarboxylase [Sulfuriferula multivorans]GBL46030.1 phosphatidylserine decarboxylase [Sulfuriferula multivorans]
MKNYPHPIIAREGWPFLAAAVLISIVVSVFAGWLWALPLWVITLFILQFFRDPPRLIPQGENLVLCPADGRVIKVERVTDPYLKREAQMVSVFMNVFNVHSNRSPVDGTIKKVWYFPGSFVNASLEKASVANERNALWIKTKSGQDVTCVQIAGLVARRILCYVKAKDKLTRGQRYGFIRFGSRVDVYLPLTARIKVSLGDKVSASSDVLAEL